MPNQPDLPNRVIAVVGMHRSGTSCVTGSLQNYGLFLGEHSTWNRHNTRGNRENQAIVELNNAVLEANGGDWLQAPNQVVWQAEHLQQGRDILKSYAQHELFGFKDPRTLLTLAGWQQLLGQRLSYVGVFRNPAAVYESILKREPVDRDTAYQAWKTYNQRLLDLRREQRFPILCFDWPEARFQRKLAAAARHLGLQKKADGENFYSAELKHHDSPAQQLPADMKAIEKRLLALSKPPRQWF